MSATALNALVNDSRVNSPVPAAPAESGPAALPDPRAGRVSRAAISGEAFTQRVQQALQSLQLTPASQTSTQDLSAVLYRLFQAIETEQTSPGGGASASAAGVTVHGIAPAPAGSSPWKPVDLASALHAVIDELQQAVPADAGANPPAGPATLRPPLAQLQADFAALVNGTTETPGQMVSTLIQFLKALQQNLPAWPPSMAAVGGTVNTVA